MNNGYKAIIFDMYETLITHFKTPLYFGSDMARDAGIPEDIFLTAWRATEQDRTLGNRTMDEVIASLLREFDCYTDELFQTMMNKRIATKIDCFNHLNEYIIPMLQGLKERGMKVALISNCFTEEAKVIRDSVLFPYFDVAMMSCEQGSRKPDEDMYLSCMKELDVTPTECIYVGDGGSNELDTARRLGITALQARWYLVKGSKQPVWILDEYEGLDSPLDIFNVLL